MLRRWPLVVRGPLVVVCIAAGLLLASTASLAAQSPLWPAASALTLPGDAVTSGQFAPVTDVACTGIGNCTAVGLYQTGAAGLPMVATQTSGTWGTAHALTLPANSVPSPFAGLSAVSCLRAGNCVAVGSYEASGSPLLNLQAAAYVRTGDRWGAAIPLTPPANAALPAAGQNVSAQGASCVSPGNCVMVGSYIDTTGARQPMVVTETNGQWGTARELGLPANATSLSATLGSVTCSGVGRCVAVGSYNHTRGANDGQAMTVTETGGAWAHATELTLPANATTAAGSQVAQLNAVSGPNLGSCAAVGSYRDSNTPTFFSAQPMVVNSVGSMSISTGSLPWDRVGSRYHAQLAAVGGGGHYRWTVAGGALPQGLVLNSRTGVISGTPIKAGPLRVTISVSDPGPPAQTASRSLSATIMPALRPHTRLLTAAISSRRRTARFAFGARGFATGFLCALQRVSTARHATSTKPHLRSCRSPKTYSRLRTGSYVFSVAATGPSGPDPHPTRRAFTI